MTLSTSGLPVSYIATSRSRRATSARLSRARSSGQAVLGDVEIGHRLIQLGLLGVEPDADRFLAGAECRRPRR